MKKIVILFIAFASCKNSTPVVIITADSLKRFDMADQKILADDIAQLDQVYNQQIELAQHSDDDSIRYYEYQLDLARAGGKNYYVLSGIERKVLLLKQDAAGKGFVIASKQAKREMDMVYEAQFREDNEKDLYTLQGKLDSNSITRPQYEASVSEVKGRKYKSTISEENAVRISMEYNKRKYAESLNKEQKLLEAKIDSESKQ